MSLISTVMLLPNNGCKDFEMGQESATNVCMCLNCVKILLKRHRKRIIIKSTFLFFKKAGKCQSV